MVAVSDKPERATVQFTLAEPMLLTSSSLGDALVRGPRRRLFEQLVLAAPEKRRIEAQARFHQHQWTAHPAFSVRMERQDARTVSRTIVRVNDGDVRLLYSPAVLDFDAIAETAA